MHLTKTILATVAVAAMLVMAGPGVTYAQAGADLPTGINSQLAQTMAKLGKIPVGSFAAESRLGMVMVETARLFLGAPYVADTLEADEERLTIRLDVFDCATLVDTVLALSRSLLLCGEKARPADMFANELRAIRYRNGRVDSYVDRLHYTTAWIAENERTGRVRNMTSRLGGIERHVRFEEMGDLMQQDRRFARSPELVAEMRRQEAALSQSPQSYIPTEAVESVLGELRPGDIICFVAAKPDLDVVHVGIFAGLTPEYDKPTFIHASSKAGRVLVEPKGLVAYLGQRKSSQGIIVVRPVDCAEQGSALRPR